MPTDPPPRPQAEPPSSGALASTPASITFPVVGIGASAGGLDACRKLLSALPGHSGMAFILVQHLDPTHKSMMVDLLAGETLMPVLQATDGTPIERDHVYVIPPATYLSVANGALRLREPQARHGARLPFDFLLHSLAEEFGARTVCVILSGTGTDGTIGLQAVKEKGGLVIAQAPEDAAHDGMPRSAIASNAVDLVLPVAEIPDALINHNRWIGCRPEGSFYEIIDLLRVKTVHDFTLYKEGTLQRRIERRVAMAGLAPGDTGRYLEVLQRDGGELALLAKDLLINVTSFFRDAQAFDFLAEKIVPALIRRQPPDEPLRIWVAGCSTGEETYSIAMVFLEQIAAMKRGIKLKVFASDVDGDAVASARQGFYPQSIEEQVSPERLGRFFNAENGGYRVVHDLRSVAVFTVQDVLADPPFSRLDLVSCRNLLIYLRPDAQVKVVSLLHFALREGGILLLGKAETPGNIDGRFEVMSKSERVYRCIGRNRTDEFRLPANPGEGSRILARPAQGHAATRQTILAELCRRLVLEHYAPAAVLINGKHECLYSMGPTDRYLRVAPGYPTHDLLAMARQGLRIKLRTAIQRAGQENARIVVPGGRTHQNGGAIPFSIDVRPVLFEGEDLLLICFVDETKRVGKAETSAAPADASRVAELEHELEVTRTELLGTIRDLELSAEEQKAINEEALSVNEEFQSTNEELLTSKEELQSLNEELTALNGQLQETLERQRTTSDDLQNVLYSTDVATLFLDTDLNIRFFTPATKALFSVIAGDVGRPLADLHSLAADNLLPADARSVLQNLAPIEREIEALGGVWFIRRILPYRTHANRVEGVVITFTDVTERKHAARALEAAKRQAELANVAKSRFLAAASHDLRQPLQTLSLLQELLARSVDGDKPRRLVARLDRTLGAMAGMLNTLLDINQIEAGIVRAEMVGFRIDDLLGRLKDEFTYHAEAQGLMLRVVSCGLWVHSDQRLLEQMIRNLLSNALKYTKHGKVLLGCRRRSGVVSVEIWDTGKGIPEGEREAIFEEYYQLDNTARERGLGLGLAIVRRVADLLGHRVTVHSNAGKGSVFGIEIPPIPFEVQPKLNDVPLVVDDAAVGAVTEEESRRAGSILLVEDDAEVREHLELLINSEGHRVTAASDGLMALDLVAGAAVQPDLILADYNLLDGMNGLQLVAKLRQTLHRQLPAIILTGDISSSTLRDMAREDCVHLNKPVKSKELTQVIQRLLPPPQSPPASRALAADHSTGNTGAPLIFVVDDDDHVREAMRNVLEEDGFVVEEYATGEAFLEAYGPGCGACLLIDAHLPGMEGIELLQRLQGADQRLPAIMITGDGDVPMAVQAMRAGAVDFIEKPINYGDLRESVDRAIEQSDDSNKLFTWREAAARHIADLTPRQREIMDMVLAGHPSKNIAVDLGISQRTVENHRASIMKKTGSKSLPALARLVLAARWREAETPPSQL